MNVEYLSQNKDLYDTFGKPGESKYYTAYVAALVSAANDNADLENATSAQASAVLNGLKNAIGVVEQGQGNATGLENELTGSEQTYLQLLQSLTNAISTTAGTNGSALRQFAIQNAALVNGLMANAAFAQTAGKLIQVEYMIAVGGGAAVPVAQELAAMCSLGAQACAAQANLIFQSLVDSFPELGGTGVGLAGISALDKEAVDQALTKAAAKDPALLPAPSASGSARRYEPGVASNAGDLPLIAAGEDWLRGTNGNAGRIPQQVADKLAGQSFTSFDQFREAFWKAVADDSALSQQFSSPNLARMQAGRAPFAVTSEQVGGRQVYELDHMQPVAQGGNVYDMNNIVIRTPLNHIKGK